MTTKPTATIFGIIYGDKTTEYTPFFNDSRQKLWRFENNCMIDIVENYIDYLTDDDYLGILSWKFRQKTGVTKEKLMSLLQNPQYCDVINLSPILGNHIHFMDWSDEGHKGIKSMVKSCCEHVGMVYNNNCDVVVYANQFLAKKMVYVDYIKTVIKPCLEILESTMWDHVNVDAGYTRAIDKETLKQHTGLEFYNYIPFILERMMMQYIYNKSLTVNQLI